MAMFSSTNRIQVEAQLQLNEFAFKIHEDLQNTICTNNRLPQGFVVQAGKVRSGTSENCRIVHKTMLQANKITYFWKFQFQISLEKFFSDQFYLDFFLHYHSSERKLRIPSLCSNKYMQDSVHQITEFENIFQRQNALILS